jgi:hypothetical protein
MNNQRIKVGTLLRSQKKEKEEKAEKHGLTFTAKMLSTASELSALAASP